MIYLFTGTPGSGKSYHAVYEIINHRGPVLTNVATSLDVDKFKLNELNPGYLREYSKNKNPTREGALLLVIDEAQLFFNSRTWNKNNRLDWLFFFMQHRKYFYNIILITQYIKMIDAQIRPLVEYEARHKATTSLGTIGLAAARLGIKGIHVNYYACGVKVFSEWYLVHKKVYNAYDTRQVLNE